jgi:CO/xanthine dehydrogenase Mo-binding subunit
MPVVGESVLRIDALGKVIGEALYPGDIHFPDQCYMKVVFARRPHARILSIDTRRAETQDGVLLVLTAKDVPNNEYGLINPDQPVLCGPGSNKAGAGIVRFIGDQVAVVVAESEEIAARACAAIAIEYEDLPVVSDPREAMKAGAPLLHPNVDSNVFTHYKIRKGDPAAGIALADVIIEGEYHTPAQEHAYLQPEAGLGYLDEEGRVTVVVGGQWVHEDQEQIAHALNLAKEQVRVIYPAIGGAFGGREDMSVQIILALAVVRLHEKGINRPVKIIWSREESMIGHHKRHPYFIKTRWGATREGKVVAAEVELIADGGAYIYTSSKVLGNAVLMCTGAYEIPNVKVDGYAVYTNNIPNGAFRGFGGPQGLFSAESQMNKLAEALGIDPVEIRMRNALQEGSLLSVGTPLPKGVSITKVLERAAVAGGWKHTEGGWARPGGLFLEAADPKQRGSKRRGIGISLGYKNVGFSYGAPENCWATVELHGKSEIEQVIVHHAAAEVGQGSHTIIAQMAAEGTGVPLDRVRLIAADTSSSDNSGSVSASRMTFMAGNAVHGAVQVALEKWQNEERPAIGRYQYRPPRTTPLDPETGKSEPNFAYGYVAEVVEVEVDTDTGQVRLLNVICVDDVGKAVNPAQVKGQMEGAIVQAAGYAILENFVQKDGYCQTPFLSNYLIPTVLDIPEQVESIILEYPDPIGPYGARGMGEMPYLPLTPAITHAVKSATGVWIDEFPLIPERVFNALLSQK